MDNLGEFKDFFKEADKLIAYRHEHRGRLPKEVWLKMIELSGRYFCLEILCVTKDRQPVLKVRHDPTATGGEKEWEGMLHIPGIAVSFAVKADEMVFSLIQKEIVAAGHDDFAQELAAKSTILGFMMYTEPERKTTADTLMMTVEIDPADPRLQPDLQVVTSSNVYTVISQHLPVLEAYSKKSEVPFFLDTRTKEDWFL